MMTEKRIESELAICAAWEKALGIQGDLVGRGYARTKFTAVARTGYPEALRELQVAWKKLEALKVAKRALNFYGKRANWREDDWGLRAVINPPDYSDAGKRARNALEKIGRMEAK